MHLYILIDSMFRESNKDSNRLIGECLAGAEQSHCSAFDCTPGDREPYGSRDAPHTTEYLANGGGNHDDESRQRMDDLLMLCSGRFPSTAAAIAPPTPLLAPPISPEAPPTHQANDVSRSTRLYSCFLLGLSI